MPTFQTFAEVEAYAAAIVSRSSALCNAHHIDGIQGVSYVAIFCQNDDMYSTVDKLVSAAGRAANVTATGTVYVVPEVPTACGPLRIVKVRVPDTSRPERGDADFRLVSSDHAALRARIDAEDALKLIDRDTFTMIELRDPAFDVRAYFSQPPVEEHGNLPEVLKEFGY